MQEKSGPSITSIHYLVLIYILFLSMTTTWAQQNVVIPSTSPINKIMSFDPSVNTILSALHLDSLIIGVNNQAFYPASIAGKKRCGSIRFPSTQLIKQLQPDLIFITPECRQKFTESRIDQKKIIKIPIHKITDIFRALQTIGDRFHKKDRAQRIIDSLKLDLNYISATLSKVQPKKRKKVAYIIDIKGDSIIIGGPDHISSDIIRYAGAVPVLRKGHANIRSFSASQWQKLDIDAILYRKKSAFIYDSLHNSKTWSGARKRALIAFPGDYLQYPSLALGDVVSMVAVQLYRNLFIEARKKHDPAVLLNSRHLPVSDLNHVKSVKLNNYKRFGFLMNSIIVTLAFASEIMSTLHGPQSNISFIGNTYLSPQHWVLDHTMNLDTLHGNMCKSLKLPMDQTRMLFTGASMEHCGVAKKVFRDLTVYALVTAGVKGNPVRTSVTQGAYYEPGTINCIILTNAKLSRRAQTRALITVTEAKTAVLQELDIRADPDRILYQATGTGTDNITIVSGQDIKIDNSGGHTKMGELIAKACRDALFRALEKQNGIMASRSLFQRLDERDLSIEKIINQSDLPDSIDRQTLIRSLDSLLLIPEYAHFLQYSFSLMATQYYQNIEPMFYNGLCFSMASQIAGSSVKQISRYYAANLSQNSILSMSINTLLTGLLTKSTSPESTSPGKIDFLSQLRKRGIHVTTIFTELVKRYQGYSQPFLELFLSELEKENRIHSAYLNLNTLFNLALQGDEQLLSDTTLPFYKASYSDDPEQFTADEYLGRAIAHTTNGQKGVAEYYALLKINPSWLSHYTPLLKQALLGYLGGILSIVNPRLNIIRVTQYIDYGSTQKKNDRQIWYIIKGSSQLDLLVKTAEVEFKEFAKHGRMVNGINQINNDNTNKSYWLSNVNNIHLFNIAPENYTLQHEDYIHWYYSNDLDDKKTK